MRILAIDTSGQACSIALVSGTSVIAERHERVGRGHAERLIGWIAELPGGGHADAIIVGCGPGSFTGVRIGVAAARALGLGWHVPVTGVSSLSLIATACDAPDFTVAIEGGHGELFVQRFARAPLTTVGALASLDPQAALALASDIIVGNAAERLVTMRGSGTAIVADARAAAVIAVPPALAALPPRPLYGRAADAVMPR